MKKLVSMLFIVLLLTAACSNKTAATSSTSGTSGTTDVAEADATSDTGATDEDDGTDEDGPAETDSGVSSDSSEPSHNPDDYWEGPNNFRLRDYYWSFSPITEKAGIGYRSASGSKEKQYMYCVVNGIHVIIYSSGLMHVRNGTGSKFASGSIRASSNTRDVIIDGEDFTVNNIALEKYILVLQNVANNPDACPFLKAGIDHLHHAGEGEQCPDF